MSSPLLLPEDTIKRIKTRDPSLIVASEGSGTRKISLGLLSPPSSASSRSTSTISSNATSTYTYISVPTHFESAPTFEFFGFTAERATELYASWSTKSELYKSHKTILDYAKDHVSAACQDAQDDTDDWAAIMDAAGIKPNIRDAILKVEHKKIRLTQSLCDWLLDIVETYSLALENMNARILAELDSSVPTIRGGGDENYTVPQMPGGHLALFKSVEFKRNAGCIAEDGTVDLARLESFGPTDFARRGGLYFTHQLWVAKHYSALITDACPVSDRRTVEIHVPLAHFAKMNTWELEFENDDFKQLLYYSRTERKYPKDLSKKRAAHGIITGPIAHTHEKAFSKMKDWTEITKKHTLQEEEEEDGVTRTKIAKQYVWINEEAIVQLDEDVFEKAYVRKPEQGFKLMGRCF